MLLCLTKTLFEFVYHSIPTCEVRKQDSKSGWNPCKRTHVNSSNCHDNFMLMINLNRQRKFDIHKYLIYRSHNNSSNTNTINFSLNFLFESMHQYVNDTFELISMKIELTFNQINPSSIATLLILYVFIYSVDGWVNRCETRLKDTWLVFWIRFQIRFNSYTVWEYGHHVTNSLSRVWR